MTDVPTLTDLILALAVVGLLFAVRAGLTLWRISAGRRSTGGLKAIAAQAFRPVAFGPEREPERRSALRQVYAAAFFGACALAVAAWSLVASVLGPFLSRGFGG